MAGLPSEGGHEKRVPCSSVYDQRPFQAEQGASQPTQTGFVVLIWIGEMKVAMILSVIKLHRNRIMVLLLNSPNETNKIQA